ISLTGCWSLEQVGQHSSDEDDLFSSMKARRYRGVRRLPSLCLSQYGSPEHIPKDKKNPQYWPTCLGRLRATLQLCWIAVKCKASPDELYSSCKSAAAQTQQEVCRLML